ncbi:MAG TPA: ATP-binding cassette domain-containing protein, partial [Chlamydiales bacterium]|nr:ATP-binding cassette domain-containing protein [Chlamydiales bacterium]
MIFIKNLTKSYFSKGKVIASALRGIDLEIREGEILTLLGVNGAGKTTLSSIIASLHPPTSGDVIWND